MKKLIFLLTFLFIWLFSNAQSPANGGFENSTTSWTGSGAASTTNARTGINSYAHTTTSTSNVAHTNSTSLSVPNNNHVHVIGWAVGSNAAARASCGGTLGTTASSSTVATIGTALTRLTNSRQNTTGVTETFTCRINTRSNAGSTTLYWDDIIMYTSTSSAVDLVVPTSPTNTAKTQSDTQISLDWDNGTDANSGLNQTYVLRTTNLAANNPTLNDQGVYSVAGGTTGPNTVGDWSIIAIISSATSNYVDNSVVTGTTYKYALIHGDLAFNHSAATIIQATALPISLTNFSISSIKNINLLTFRTESEQNSAYFEIERSQDGKDFTSIGRVEGARNSITTKNYEFEDKSPLKGLNYYRLKQVDFDGRFEYSKVISSYFGEKGLNVNIISAQNEQLRLKVQSADNQDATVAIVDMNGRVVAHYVVDLSKGENDFTLNTSLQNGMYAVKITTSNGEQVSKLMKY